jgi:biotin carboxylase
MRRPLIVYIDTIGVASAATIAAAAARRGIATALICSPGSIARRRSGIARIIETRDFRAATLRRLLARLDRRYRIRGFCSLFGPYRRDGFLHQTVATLAAERGLAYSPPEALAAATNKFLTRLSLGAAGVPDIPYGVAGDEGSLVAVARAIGYPVILKPLTGVGSSLIFRCDDEVEARKLWRRALRRLPHAYYEHLRMAPHTFTTPQGAVLHFDPSKSMLVERYLPGREASVECVAAGDDIVALVVHDKIALEEKPGVVLEHLLVAPPVRFTAREVRQLCRHAVDAVRAVGLRNTFCHVELRWLDGAGPRVLEVNPRIGAGCVTDSIETFTNLKVDAAVVALVLGKKLPKIKPRRAPRHAMIFLFSPRAGRLTKLEGLEAVNDLPQCKVVRVMHAVGDRVGGDMEEGFLAGIWMEAHDAHAARQAYAQVRRLVDIVVS